MENSYRVPLSLEWRKKYAELRDHVKTHEYFASEYDNVKVLDVHESYVASATHIFSDSPENLLETIMAITGIEKLNLKTLRDGNYIITHNNETPAFEGICSYIYVVPGNLCFEEETPIRPLVCAWTTETDNHPLLYLDRGANLLYNGD